jgi:hypothetical protein
VRTYGRDPGAAAAGSPPGLWPGPDDRDGDTRAVGVRTKVEATVAVPEAASLAH